MIIAGGKLSDRAEKKDLRQIIRDIDREKDDQEYYETYVEFVAEKNPAVFMGGKKT